MFDIGGPELLLVLFIALLVLGPRRLPEVGRRIGQAVGHLRRATREMRTTLEREVALDEVKKGAQAADEELRRELDTAKKALSPEPQEEPVQPRPSEPSTSGPSSPGATGAEAPRKETSSG